MSPDLWVPGAAEPSLEDFVARVLRQIERYTVTHTAERSHVEVELGDGEHLTLQSISSEPGYGFLTLTVPDGEQLIVPVGATTRTGLLTTPLRDRFGIHLGRTVRQAKPPYREANQCAGRSRSNRPSALSGTTHPPPQLRSKAGLGPGLLPYKEGAEPAAQVPLLKCPPPPQNRSCWGLRSAAVQSFEDRWYVSEHASPTTVDSSPFGWFIRVLHFTHPGESQIRFPPRF